MRKQTHTHHINLNHSDNRPENKVELSPKDHARAHCALWEFIGWHFGLSPLGNYPVQVQKQMQAFLTKWINIGFIFFDRDLDCYRVPIKSNGEIFLWPIENEKIYCKQFEGFKVVPPPIEHRHPLTLFSPEWENISDGYYISLRRAQYYWDETALKFKPKENAWMGKGNLQAVYAP